MLLRSRRMRLISSALSTAAAIAVSCVVSAAAYYYRSRSAEINEVMIFCKFQYNPFNCFDKLMSYIEAAEYSVNVCMPGIHNPAIQGRLVDLILRKNIKIRILIDKSGYNESTKPFIKDLVDAGVQMRYTCKMQHQFCVIDDRTAMTGTLNWGDDLSLDHWNYVYVTNKRQLVQPVCNEFYKIWENLPEDNWITETSDTSCASTPLSERGGSGRSVGSRPNAQILFVHSASIHIKRDVEQNHLVNDIVTY